MGCNTHVQKFAEIAALHKNITIQIQNPVIILAKGVGQGHAQIDVMGAARIKP